MKILFVVVLLALAALVVSQPSPLERVGAQRDGSVLLPTGWRVRPAGRQIPLDTFPMASVLSPDGKHLVVLHGGYNPPSVAVLDARTEKEISRAPAADGWLGLAISPNGRVVYAGGGSRASVFEFTLSPEGQIAAARTFVCVPEGERTHRNFIGDVALTPDGRLIYAADLFQDQVLVINPSSGRVIDKFKTGRRPYRILFHPDGKSYFVTSWVDGALYHHQTDNGAELSRLRLGPHPTDMVWRDKKTIVEEGEEMPWKARLFVTAANTNKVYVVGVTEAKELRQVETINVAMTPRQPLGMTPSALALNEDQTRLFVVCSDANAVAVADVSGKASRVLGFLPTGWYPIAARSLPDGRLFVFNGRGPRSFPNPRGPNPSVRPSPVHLGPQAVQYVGRLQRGSASVIDAFDEEQLSRYSRTVVENSPYRDALLDHVETGAGNPVPSRPGAPSPIQHVLYIVKENRTYDQIFGALGKGNGDPSLVLFGEEVTPNHHKLARDFVLLDNFYVNADVSADGHNWSSAAIANAYVQRMWPNSYASRRRHYDYEGQEPAATPPAGYIWTNAAAAGVSLRNYGYFVDNSKQAAATGESQITSVRDAVLARVTNQKFRGFDLDYPDVDRARMFLQDLAEWERGGDMPRFLILRLGNDHTSGTTAGRIAPRSAVADNDYALGQIVDACSRSRFWSRMAIFVLEDDAQNGPDHVDSHRAPAFVLSPYTRGGRIDSSMYNTTSMLRTMELILGLQPMTHFDAGARPMSAAFSTTPNPAPYTVEKPRISLEDRNPAASPTQARSARLDFSEADKIDDDELNDILWRAIRKDDPPPPVRSYFSR